VETIGRLCCTSNPFFFQRPMEYISILHVSYFLFAIRDLLSALLDLPKLRSLDRRWSTLYFVVHLMPSSSEGPWSISLFFTSAIHFSAEPRIVVGTAGTRNRIGSLMTCGRRTLNRIWNTIVRL
jgi:hypothetical protein